MVCQREQRGVTAISVVVSPLKMFLCLGGRKHVPLPFPACVELGRLVRHSPKQEADFWKVGRHPSWKEAFYILQVTPYLPQTEENMTDPCRSSSSPKHPYPLLAERTDRRLELGKASLPLKGELSGGRHGVDGQAGGGGRRDLPVPVKEAEAEEKGAAYSLFSQRRRLPRQVAR